MPKLPEKYTKCFYCQKLKPTDTTYSVEPRKYYKTKKVCNSCYRFYRRGMTYNREKKAWEGFRKSQVYPQLRCCINATNMIRYKSTKSTD